MRALLLALLPMGTSDEVSPADVRVGHWIEVRGEYADGTFQAEKAELLEPEEYEVLIGTVERDLDPGERFVLLGQEVHVSDDTDWDVERGPLAGTLVKVEGLLRGPRNFSAREIRSRNGGRDRIAGRVDSIKRAAGGYELRVLRYRVFLPDGAEVEAPDGLADLEIIEPRFRVDDWNLGFVNEDDLFGPGIRISESLRFTGQIETRYQAEDEWDLNPNDDENRYDTRFGFRGRLGWEPGGPWSGVLTFRQTFLQREDAEDGYDSRSDFRFAETFLRWQDPESPFEVWAGRLDFDDPREWLYDQNLDGVLLAHRGALDVEVSASTTLSDGSPVEEETDNAIVYVSNGSQERHLAAYAVHRDSGPFDVRTTHLGARALGEWVSSDLESWVEVAHMIGERSGEDTIGWGIDVGTTWEPDFAEPVSFVAGYALGTGDGSPGGTDRTFRQTGLQDNNATVNGVTSIRYYGELLEPELANLGVTTLGFGVRLDEKTSVELIWHRYWQDHAIDFLVDTELDRRPTGLDPDIGWELDLILGSRRWDAWDIELIGAMFDPGDAFDTDEKAYVGKIQVRYRF